MFSLKRKEKNKYAMREEKKDGGLRSELEASL